MDKQQYEVFLKTKNINTLNSYGSGSFKKNDILYGVIMSTKEIKKYSNPERDRLLTCYITDPSLEGGIICLNVFDKNENILKLFQEDYIIVIKNFALRLFNSNPQITINKYSSFSLYQPKTQERVETKHSDAYVDTEIIKTLDEWNQKINESTRGKKPTARPLLQTAELIDHFGNFFDYVGQIVSITFNEEHDKNAVITLTDFTKNPSPPTNVLKQKIIEKEYLINGTLWDEHVIECKYLQVGDYVLLRNCVKKYGVSNELEFALHGSKSQNTSRNLVYKLSDDDDRLSKLMEEKNKYQNAFKKRSRNVYEAHPIRTEFIKKKRGGFKSLGTIKSDKMNGVFETKACITNYHPLDIKDWIKGYCQKCNNYCVIELPCHQCKGPTTVAYKFSLTLKNEEKEELLVHAYFGTGDVLFPQVLAKDAFSDKPQFEKLKKIVNLATDPDLNIFFDFAINTHSGLSQFINTKFILTEDDDE